LSGSTSMRHSFPRLVQVACTSRPQQCTRGIERRAIVDRPLQAHLSGPVRHGREAGAAINSSHLEFTQVVAPLPGHGGRCSCPKGLVPDT